MTDKPDAVAELVERLLQLAGNTGKITWVNNKPETASDALRQSAATLTTLSRRNAELEVERTELRQLLHDVRLEASEIIPPDGKAAAFAALHQICLMISTRAALGGSTDDKA